MANLVPLRSLVPGQVVELYGEGYSRQPFSEMLVLCVDLERRIVKFSRPWLMPHLLGEGISFATCGIETFNVPFSTYAGNDHMYTLIGVVEKYPPPS